MAKAESNRSSIDGSLNIEFMRSLVKQYSELGQWTSAMFWADAAAAAAGSGPEAPSGDDIWLLASTMLARGELHRAAHTVTSRGLHRRHLLCLGVAMRAFLVAREPNSALSLMEECDPMLLEAKNTDQTHNRALAGVLVSQARALTSLERREAAAEALAAALQADCACYEALDLLLDQHALTASKERELVESVCSRGQLGGAEGELVRTAYRSRLRRHAPASPPALPAPLAPPAPPTAPSPAEEVWSRTASHAGCAARRLAAAGRWAEALDALEPSGPWASVEVRAACLVELKRTPQLFALAHTLVDAYPNAWTSWFAVGCYYYLIGKSEPARRYLSKAKSLEPSAGCVWLAYGHSFAADNEHDQAMAAYFKATQLMPGCHLPPLYVGVECSLQNNVCMCERFLHRAALLHANAESMTDLAEEPSDENTSGWERIGRVVREPHVAHEAAAAAYAAGDARAARALWLGALPARAQQLSPVWAASLDGLGHSCRALGMFREALEWHERALALRPGRASTYAAMGLCLALLGEEPRAADALHAALARDPDDVVALALLDAIVDRLDATLTEEEIPQFPFPAVSLAPAASPRAGDTHTSDMSMSFD